MLTFYVGQRNSCHTDSARIFVKCTAIKERMTIYELRYYVITFLQNCWKMTRKEDIMFYVIVRMCRTTFHDDISID